MFPLIVGDHSTGDAIKTKKRWIKNINYLVNAVRDTGVPLSSVLGTTDKHEESNIVSGIQNICMMERTVQAPEFPSPEMIVSTSHAVSTDKKRDDRSVTNQSEAFSGRCKLVLLR